ncbi:MAG TPA: ABC transporter substrate-binding protein, partial [Clostridia bacterium]
TSIADLKGKKIGVTASGNGSMVVTSDLLKENGIDPVKNISWDQDTEENLLNKLQNNKVDAVCILEYQDKPKNTLKSAQRLIYSSSEEKQQGKSYKHFYESFIGFNSQFLKNNRKEAFQASIAWLKAAQWVANNQKEALNIAVSKGYIDNKTDLGSIMNKYMWMPGVKYARDNAGIYVKWQRAHGIISKSLREDEFMKKVYDPLIPELNGR